jgi:hypothetical protein
MKIEDAALRLAATEAERLGWLRHLRRMDAEYRRSTMLAYDDPIMASVGQIRARKRR